MGKLAGIHKEEANLSEISQLLKDSVMSNLNCHNIGRIIEFDSTTQTCTVELMQIKQFNDQAFIPAPITQVPLIIYGSDNSYITLPNPVGSICLLLFLDRNIDNFLETGEQYMPETSRMHDFTDAVALTTFKTLANPIENYDDNAITMYYKTIINEVLYEAVIKNAGNAINLKMTNGDNYSQINIASKIKIENNNQNLYTLIGNLITAINNITITNNAVSSASKTALNNVKTQFGELLE